LGEGRGGLGFFIAHADSDPDLKFFKVQINDRGDVKGQELRNNEAAYHREGDPEGRTFAEILVDVVAAEVIEPWGGGKWHLEIFRSSSPEAEDWNGEM